MLRSLVGSEMCIRDRAICRKRCKIAGKLVLIADRKLYMSFRLVPKSVTVTRPCTSAELRQAPRCCLACRSPQGSVLGPKVFSQYAEDVADIFRRHNIHHHLFADEMQGHSSSLLMDAAIVTTQLSSCAKDICNWCEAKRLQLNASKTELLWFGTA